MAQNILEKSNGNQTNCLLINNLNSGKSKGRDLDAVLRYLNEGKDTPTSFITYDGTQNPDEYDSLLVFGGDGTVSNALNDYHVSGKMFYVPCGTVNDFGKIKREQKAPLILGKVNDKRFCYVLATGSFTSIGYQTKRKYKEKIGRIAYLLNALKELKIHRLDLKINADGRILDGQYTLVMILRSPRCFGFNFNGLYDQKENKLYCLLIKSPKLNAPLGIVPLFIRFFRTFFMGYKQEKHGGVEFFKCNDLTIEASKNLTYCLDGEEYLADKKIKVSTGIKRLHLKKRRGFTSGLA